MIAVPIGDSGFNSDGDIGYRPMAEINVTPFVDVMLVLLVIFMVAAPLMMVGVSLDLPKTTAAEIARSGEPIVVSLDRDGGMFIADAPVAADDLMERLAQLRSERPDSVVYVRGDKGVDYGRVLALLVQVGRAGFARISLVAESAPDAGKP